MRREIGREMVEGILAVAAKLPFLIVVCEDAKLRRAECKLLDVFILPFPRVRRVLSGFFERDGVFADLDLPYRPFPKVLVSNFHTEGVAPRGEVEY